MDSAFTVNGMWKMVYNPHGSMTHTALSSVPVRGRVEPGVRLCTYTMSYGLSKLYLLTL